MHKVAVVRSVQAFNFLSRIGSHLGFLCAIFLLLLTPAFATSPQSPAVNSGDPGSRVVAKVGTSSITLGEVCFQLGIDADQGATQLAPAMLHRTVHLLGLQRQALQTLRKMKMSAKIEEIESWVKEQQQGRRTPPVSDESLRELADFRLSWRAYLGKQLNEKNLERHFSKQQPRFDGTSFDIQMVSLAVPPGQSKERQAAIEKLKETLSLADTPEKFAEVAERMTQSEELEAELFEGQVRGTGDIDPAVITQLLQMKAGETSPIFSTAIAVHAVRLNSVQPGELKLEEVVGEVRGHMLVYLLEYLASQSDTELPLLIVEDE